MFDSHIYTNDPQLFDPIAFCSQNPPRPDPAIDRMLDRMIDRRKRDVSQRSALQALSDRARLLAWQTTCHYVKHD